VEEMDDVIDFIYPPDVLCHPVDCLKRSILVLTNRQVDAYNDAILRCIEGRKRLYMAADFLKEVNAAGLTSPASMLDFAAKTNTTWSSFSFCVYRGQQYILPNMQLLPRPQIGEKRTSYCYRHW
jgi:hypothetical protein